MLPRTNNRFLQRVNPEIVRLKTDSVHPETTILNISDTDYVIHAYKRIGSSTFNPPSGVSSIDVLIVAGGGGGGISAGEASGAGAGGAGGLIFETDYDVSSKTNISVVVGDGGGVGSINTDDDGSNGDNSEFDNLDAIGGGGGGGRNRNGLTGGSGGGGGRTGVGASGTSGQGNAGGDGEGGIGDNPGGGGGGYGSPGDNGVIDSHGGDGGDGGDFSSYFGTDFGDNGWFSGGGGGGISGTANTPGVGGNGGGGGGGNHDEDGLDGMVNTGGGGGGGGRGGSTLAGKGGSGIVLIRYPLSNVTNVNDIYKVDTTYDIVIVRNEIQSLMRQMVDMGIADNLKLWVHSGLVKTRTSGDDLFVSKAYDISGAENDAAQATEANQPELVSDGMEFIGSSFQVLVSSLTTEVNYFFADTTTPWSLSIWYNGSTGVICGAAGGVGVATTCVIYLSSSDLRVRLRGNSSDDLIQSNTSDWNHITITWDMSNGYAYFNGGSAISLTPGTATIQINPLCLGWCNTNTTSGNYAHFTGKLNDARAFNSAITQAQNNQIYELTKSKYGHA